MNEAENQLLTASDLMSRDVETVGAEVPLRNAAAQFLRREVHGAPVVDGAGRCIGVLSVSDLARWASGQGEPKVQLPRTCAYQTKHREPGGHESVLCRLAEGACPFQRLREMPDGRMALACIEPHGVPIDWQMVELESLPGDAVRDFMTTTVVTAEPTTPVPEMARLMLEHRMNRLVVLDIERRPVGVVTVNDLLQVLAHPEIVAPGDAR
jgi:CBS domain-containing protein